MICKQGNKQACKPLSDRWYTCKRNSIHMDERQGKRKVMGKIKSKANITKILSRRSHTNSYNNNNVNEKKNYRIWHRWLQPNQKRKDELGKVIIPPKSSYLPPSSRTKKISKWNREKHDAEREQQPACSRERVTDYMT